MEIYLKTVELSFCCSQRPVASFKNDIVLLESAIAIMGSDFVLFFTPCVHLNLRQLFLLTF